MLSIMDRLQLTNLMQFHQTKNVQLHHQIKLAVNAEGNSSSDSQSTLVLLATKALVKPPKDMINDAIPNHSIIQNTV